VPKPVNTQDLLNMIEKYIPWTETFKGQ